MTTDRRQTPGNSARDTTHIPYVPALDGVRAASILLVMAAHMLPLGPQALEMNAMAAKMGMSLFFCLSGYLIVSMIHRNPDVITFLTRRMLRIVPSVVMYMVILVLLFGLGIPAVLSNLLFVTNYWTVGLSDGPLGHMWSLSVEMHFYLAIAALTLVFGLNSVWFVPVAALAITLLRVDAGAYVNIKTHLRADEILSGGCLALVALYHGERLRRFFGTSRHTVVALIVLGLLWAFSCRDDGGALNYLRPYLAASLVGIVMHCRWRPLLAVLEGPVAAYIARISYALYIYHMLMIWGWMNEGSTMERYLLKRPLSFALTFAAAHVSTFYWESYWQALAKRLTRNRPAHAPAE